MARPSESASSSKDTSSPASGLRLFRIPRFPEIRRGDDLPKRIADSARKAGMRFEDGDILVVAQKIVSFGLGNDLLSDDKNVAIFEAHPSFPRRIRYSFGKVISPANFREPRDAKQPQAGSGRRSVLRGRGGFKRSGHGRGKGNLTRAGESFHLSRSVPQKKNGRCA